MNRIRLAAFLGFPALAGILLLARASSQDARPALERVPPQAPLDRSPIHISLSPDGLHAYVLNHTSDSVSVLDVRGRKVASEIPVGPRPAHAVVSGNGRRLFVTSLHGDRVEAVDLRAGRVESALAAGPEPCGMVLSANGRTLSVAASLSNAVAVLDVASGATLAAIPVGYNPRYLAATPDGTRLVVANGLSRDVSIIDAASHRVVETRNLVRASLLRQIACSPDGRWAFVAHIVSHDEMVPFQIERGWIHSNGISVLDLERPGRFVTILLDRLTAGAAFPWGLALSSDGSRLYVSLAGAHEVAFVDVPKALRLVEATPPEGVKLLSQDVEIAERLGIARRFPSGGLGPRGIVLSEATGELLVANYFSDDVAVLDAVTGEIRATIPLREPPAAGDGKGAAREASPSLLRRGEMLFNDARITYQGWFSCASCHQEDATMDALNWDLPNDGIGNPKNTKSMHDIADTPPAMWSGLREDMDAAVAAGQRFAGLLPDADNHRALMAYLSSPLRAPNPYCGLDPEAGRRGERAFRKARCASCHPPPLYTDLHKYDLGLAAPADIGLRFDTPTLRECYRTAPYLHDGRARTLREVLTVHNRDDCHGRVFDLGESELDDLIAFLRTL